MRLWEVGPEILSGADMPRWVLHMSAVLGYERAVYARRTRPESGCSMFAWTLAGFVYEMESRYYTNVWTELAELSSSPASREAVALCKPHARVPAPLPRLKDMPPPGSAAADLREHWGEVWHCLLEMACVWEPGYSEKSVETLREPAGGATSLYQGYGKRSRDSAPSAPPPVGSSAACEPCV